MIKKNIPFILLIFLAISMQSCLTQNMMQKPMVKNNMPDGFFTSSASKQYIIKPDDKINISIWGHDELSVGSVYGIYNSNEVYGKWIMVDPNGEVQIPKIGSLKIAGMNILEAEDSIKRIVSKWLINPIIFVRVLNKEVVVMGEVKAPGRLTFDKGQYTLAETVAMAGDFDFYANKKKIIVVRTVNGFQKQITLDLTRSDRFTTNNIPILPGDLVYIPSKRAKDFDRRISTIAPFTSVVTTLVVLYTALLKK
ncbi:MAG: Amylovoran export outer membrane protein amsH [Bacteroidota bacterium]|jgi:polysaccharide export outer membrane protein